MPQPPDSSPPDLGHRVESLNVTTRRAKAVGPLSVSQQDEFANEAEALKQVLAISLGPKRRFAPSQSGRNAALMQRPEIQTAH